jgi:hypothetical protein
MALCLLMTCAERANRSLNPHYWLVLLATYVCGVTDNVDIEEVFFTTSDWMIQPPPSSPYVSYGKPGLYGIPKL